MRDQLENIDDDDDVIADSWTELWVEGEKDGGFYDNKLRALFSKVFYVLKAFFVLEMLNLYTLRS